MKEKCVTEAEHCVGTSENIDENLHLSDIVNGEFLNTREKIEKYYEIVDIVDIQYLRMHGKGRCTHCHAAVDDTCGKKLVRCLNNQRQCYRRKYIV